MEFVINNQIVRHKDLKTVPKHGFYESDFFYESDLKLNQRDYLNWIEPLAFTVIFDSPAAIFCPPASAASNLAIDARAA